MCSAVCVVSRDSTVTTILITIDASLSLLLSHYCYNYVLYSDILWFPPQKQANRIRAASLVVATLVTAVIACIAGVYGLKYYLVYQSRTSWGPRVRACIHTVLLLM
jgi:hypothetical protein